MNLSPHFTYEDMTFSEIAKRKNWDNAPDERLIGNLKFCAEKMEFVRDLLGGPIIITSAYRGWRVNEAIGGAETSSHCTGLAVDFKPIEPYQMVPYDLFIAAKKIEASSLQYDQIILEYGWIHLGFGPQMRRESLTKKSASSPYLKGLVK